MSQLPSYALGHAHLDSADVARAVPLVPRNAVLALLHGYRATISHLYGDVCRYYPSCSAYAVGAVQQHGALKGAALAAPALGPSSVLGRGLKLKLALGYDNFAVR
ncbi:MAG TPA: membrane protein insertion efficiency factor YidD, partial [Microbacterium sp.]|nr:membrane protein insertion efficiency factor YidD [Microbacterium sp.]